ncbi:hypothetical protein HXX76_014727 [Chlamydomonas incerta]|uniref:Sulfotransferase n=1 Tax=Chlamydomonas incerta TaxID=51695 RepID=A0A835SC09_CHLIN|nr:hypothetical protein HXX76_014727 [Chlamydomonas incerta]|eukprot:KAG2424194.1 hypothetical protein HXX76_014727 [Chlamydomonas incerta]
MKNPYLTSVGGPDQKDTHYFSGTGSKWDDQPLCDNEIEPYLRLTAAARRRRNSTNLQVGDFSPTHFHCLCCAASLRMANPSMKVVVLLRDPVARALSKFLELKQQRHLSSFYMDALEIYSYTFVSYVEAELAVMRRCSDTARRFRSSASPRSRLLAAAGRRPRGAAMPRGWGAGWDMGQWMEAQCYARSSILGWSMYDVFLENYAAQFGWRQMKVVYTHDLLTAPNDTLHAVEDFLGAPRARLHPNDKLDDLVNTRDCYSEACSRKRRQLRPYTEALGARAGGATALGDNALVDDLWDPAAAVAAGGAATASAAAASTGSSSSGASGGAAGTSPFGQAVAALRQLYAPHMQQLFTWADQGVIPQPPQAWRAAYADIGGSSTNGNGPGRRLQEGGGGGSSSKLRG